MADDLALPARLRPQTRLLRLGAHTLTDAELLAVLLYGERVGEQAIAHAEWLLRAVGGVPGLARSHPEALVGLPGLGEATVARLVAALALPARRDPFGQVTVTCLDDFVLVFRPVLTGLQRECLTVAVCDRGNRVRAVRIVGEGTSDGAPLPVRDIIATVLRHDGHAFAIAHNHPSGNTTPSHEDRRATIRCHNAADTAGLVFHGHLIIGDNGTWNIA